MLSGFDYGNRHSDRSAWSSGKASSWMMQALSAKDHLRQQVAWSLSHIFVVSSQEVGENHLNTMWAHVHGNLFEVFWENLLDARKWQAFPSWVSAWRTLEFPNILCKKKGCTFQSPQNRTWAETSRWNLQNTGRLEFYKGGRRV